MNTADLSRVLQDLFRLHPLPWRDNGFGYTDHRGYAVGPGQCARLLADHGYDIVSLVEQCVSFGAPEDVKFAVDDEIAEAEKASSRELGALQDELDESEKEVKRLESEVNFLERRVDELEDELRALREEYDELRFSNG